MLTKHFSKFTQKLATPYPFQEKPPKDALIFNKKNPSRPFEKERVDSIRSRRSLCSLPKTNRKSERMKDHCEWWMALQRKTIEEKFYLLQAPAEPLNNTLAHRDRSEEFFFFLTFLLVCWEKSTFCRVHNVKWVLVDFACLNYKHECLKFSVDCLRCSFGAPD